MKAIEELEKRGEDKREEERRERSRGRRERESSEHRKAAWVAGGRCLWSDRTRKRHLANLGEDVGSYGVR